jgi:prolyl oligopeptidase
MASVMVLRLSRFAIVAIFAGFAVQMPVTEAEQVKEERFPARGVGASEESLYSTFQSYWEWKLATQPELATRVGRTEFNDKWRDLSKSARDKARERRKQFLQEMIYINSGNLTPADRLSANILIWEIRNAIEMEPYSNLVGGVSQQGGFHGDIFSTIDQMPARTLRDYENMIARLNALPVLVDQYIALLREQINARVTQPQVVVDLVLQQVSAQANMPASTTPLLGAFRAFPESIRSADRQRLLTVATVAYDKQVAPSWKRLDSFLRNTYRPRARARIAVTSLPAGRALYDAAVRFHTTTSMTAEEIHRLGLSEVARIEQEMEQVARADGFTGPANQYETSLANRPGMRFTNQQEMLDYAQDVLARVQPTLPKLFKRLPKMQVQIRPIPADREASTASNYEAGTTDGSRLASFNMNTYKPQEQFKYDIEALVLHETVPGHHLQTAIARELENVPEFQRVFTTTAFGEGWALYAESLGPETGVVFRDPPSKMGQLANEQFRAVRLVVDTGMHVMGWSRERAREYFKSHVPAQSLAEIDRYIAWPGQALAYKIGQLKILELRRRAEKELGAKFDVRDFHDVVLRNGRLPLDLLEEQVSEYIGRTR